LHVTFRLRRGDRRLTRRRSALLTIASVLCALVPLAGAATADAAPQASVTDVVVAESATQSVVAQFTIVLSEPSVSPVSVTAGTLDGTATSLDYGRRTPVAINFAPGETRKLYNVNLKDDLVDEFEEFFYLQLTNPQGGVTIGDAFGMASVQDNDGPPTLSFSDVSLNEPGTSYANATFTLSLDRKSEKPISVRVDTTPGTADNADYSTRSAVTVQFPAGVTSRPVSVPVRPGDTVDEFDETFHLDASVPFNVTIGDGRGTATIIDDDPPPTLSINDVSVVEGDSAYVNATFSVSLAQRSGKPVNVVVNTSADTAGSSDYSTRSNVLLSFPAGTTSRPISVPVRPDTVDEFNETFNANLSSPSNATILDGTGVATIEDNDAPPLISIGDVSVVEPFSGETSARVAVTLSARSEKPITVQHTTTGGDATPGVDYQARSNTISLPAGTTSTTTGVNVFADNSREPDEVFYRQISNAVNATIDDAFGASTIAANCYDKEPSSAPTAMDLGSVAGDSGAEQVFSPAGASICPGDVDWYKIELRETDQANDVYHSASLHLDVPDVAMNGDVDMHVFDEEGDAASYDSSDNSGTLDEDIWYWYDDTSLDDTAYFWVQIIGKPDPATGAPATNDYTLSVTGNTE
jgi:hypothetical protein